MNGGYRDCRVFYFMFKECYVCKKSFNVKPGKYDYRFCCSKKCQSERFRETLAGERNPNYKQGGRINKCKVCGELFKEAGVYFNKKTCSDICYKKSLSALHLGKKMSKESVEKQKVSHRVTLILKGAVLNEISSKCICGGKKDVKAKNCFICFRNRIKHKRHCIICNKHLGRKGVNVKTCSIHCSKIHKSNISRDDKNPMWKGGVKPEHQRQRNTNKYKDWRKSVFERDKYTCQNCGQIGGKLHAHHKKDFSNHPKLRLDTNNGETLCIKCHSIHHPWMNIRGIKY